jgi:hypothetical protein
MYGMVNRAVEDLVTKRFGEATWERIKARAGVDVDVFLSMQTYPDPITYSLVGAASQELSLSAETVLEVFGEHWVEYAAANGYRDLMRARGQSLFAFIARLDDLHARLALSFASLKPPSFRTSEVTEQSLRLHYFSTREGLAPMVKGLIRGLGKLFEVEVDITQELAKAAGADHDEFIVTLREAKGAVT